MEYFENKTTAGNEKALKRGHSVPDGAVNLAWAKSPSMNPEKNVVIVDTSRIVQENGGSQGGRKLMYANVLGILEDEYGNQIVHDEFPIVTDVFKKEEDWVTTPGNEYGDEDVLPFVHTSRYFHVDFAGLTNGSGMDTILTDQIKVVDSHGRPYLSAGGNARFKIKIAAARANFATGTQAAYRVFAFVDSDTNEDLYLTYNKVELATDGTFKNQHINFKELLNPQPFFEYRPEESEVADPANRRNRWYCTKPASLKEQVLGIPSQTVDGYRIFVPRKAITDPRIFQLFRWRVSCKFDSSFRTGHDQDRTVKCGIIVTNSDPLSSSPYAFYNLEKSAYNIGSLKFVNPLQTDHSDGNKTHAAYWQVNIDTVTSDAELSQFDILVWAPYPDRFDFTPYQGFINRVTNGLGKLLYIDTNGSMSPVGLDVTTTAGYGLIQAIPICSGVARRVRADKMNVASDSLLAENASMGGWDISNSSSLTWSQSVWSNFSAGQFITAAPGYSTVVQAPEDGRNGVYRTVTTDYLYGRTVGGTSTDGGLTLRVTVPTVPAGAQFAKLEIFHLRNWTGATNATGILNLDAGGVFSKVHSDTMGSSGSMSTADGIISTDSTLQGKQIVSSFTTTGNVTSYGLLVTISYIDSVSWSSDGYLSTTQQPVTVHKKMGAGDFVFSTAAHLQTCSGLYSYNTRAEIRANRDVQVYSSSNYQFYINSAPVAGSMKLLYNMVMRAVADRSLSALGDTTEYSTVSFATKWFSSWVINAENGVLSDEEKNRYDFALAPNNDSPPHLMWQRRLSSKTCKQLMDTAIAESGLSADTQSRINALGRTYVIEVTNTQVEHTVVLGDNSYPYAWTNAFTPKFILPADMGPSIVKEDEVLASGFETGQSIHRSYPAKPYSGQIRVISDLTSTFSTSQTANWSVSGSATESWDVTNTVPPSSYTSTSEVELNWQNASSHDRFIQGSPSFAGANVPAYIATWQENNYYTNNWGNGHLNWPFWGLTGRYGVGSSGEVVTFIQEFLNTMNYLTITFNPGGFGAYTLPGGYLAIDGSYGQATATAVRAFQQTFTARYVDGTVDAETWSLIGGQIIRWGLHRDGRPEWGRFYDWPYGRMLRESISDGDINTPYAKRSWLTGGPSVIWEMFMVTFAQQYPIHAVSFTPYVEGRTPTVMWRSIDVRTQPFSLHNYDSNSSMIRYMPYRLRDMERMVVPFSPVWGDTIIIGVGQDGPGYDSDRILGIREMSALAEVDTVNTIPGYTTITRQSRTIPLHASGTVNVSTRNDVVIQLQANYTGGNTISNIQWDTASVTVDNSNVQHTLTTSGQLTLSNYLIANYASTGVTVGPKFGYNSGTTYFSMTPSGVIDPVPETGWISKSDGLRLLCDANGNSVGVPGMPTQTGPNDTQRHFSTISLVTYGNDATIEMGLYDRNRQEFVVDAGGNSTMSYDEYEQRGPQNIYIAVRSSLEIDEQVPIPVDSDIPHLPHRSAMPVYGVYERTGTRITLESLPKNLNSEDVWPVAVRTGSFHRRVHVRSYQEGPLTTYLAGYQGYQVTAYYGIPEAGLGGWSSLYGRPNADVRGEEPNILDDNVIQVRQTPILMEKQPTAIPTDADPVRPIFTVYKRTTRTDPWVALPWSEITDYNVSTGEIFLRTTLASNDSGLLKVDYTTERRHYYFKQYNNTLLNLNPYPGQTQGLIGKALYIYIVPEYVKDMNGTIISASVQSRTLRFTTSPNVFDPVRPEYDPLAIQLGTIYITTAIDSDDVVILDTRRRGGGAKDTFTNDEVIHIMQEASAYWDVNYGAGMSYQKGGFIVIRIPEEIRDYVNTDEIKAAIERNLTAGVQYKIEDMSGVDWS